MPDFAIKNSNTRALFLPSADEELLLKAALMGKQESARCWNEWRSRNDLHSLEAGSQRLVPQLSRTLIRHGIEDPWMDRLKGAFRRTWVQNQTRLRGLASLINSFEKSGIRVLVHKGIPLALLYYQDIGARPMNDVDLLVSPGDASRAVDLLRDLGYSPMIPLFTMEEPYLSYRHSVGLQNGNGPEIDLHWHLTFFSSHHDADHSFWERSRKADFGGFEARILDPTDQFLQVLTHGTLRYSIRPIRWVADAVMIARSSRIKPEMVISEALRQDIVLQIRETVAYLCETFPDDFHDSLRLELNKQRIARLARLEYGHLSQSSAPAAGFKLMQILYAQYRRTTIRKSIPGFARFLKYVFNLKSVWRVPSWVMNRASKRFFLFLRAAGNPPDLRKNSESL